jgi:hypothetical protein
MYKQTVNDQSINQTNKQTNKQKFIYNLFPFLFVVSIRLNCVDIVRIFTWLIIPNASDHTNLNETRNKVEVDRLATEDVVTH